MEKKTACVVCGNESLRLDEAKKTVEIDGNSIDIPFRIHWCETCGSQLAINEDLRFNARAMRQARKKQHGLLTGEDVREIRRQLGLSQEQAATIFGGGPVAFSKYENDEVTQSGAMDSLLRLVATHPELLSVLRTQTHRDIQSQTGIRVNVTIVQFDEEVSARAQRILEETSLALEGFHNFYVASNDSVYDQNQSPRPVKWSTA